MHPVIADGGELTILRSLASYSYGKWDVSWTESVPDDQRPDAGDDREFGYFSDFSRPAGRMARRFVRGDVSITAAEYVDGEKVPLSGITDVEEVLDQAEERTAGGPELEREITRAGLGALVPYVDFSVGDIIPVKIWNLWIDLPVRQIEMKSQVGAEIDYSVFVGTDLLADKAQGDKNDRELLRTIFQERREARQELKQASSKLSGRIDAESSARRADVESVRGVLTGGGEHQQDLLASLEGLNRQLRRNGEEPAPGLIPAYLQMNTQLWKVQQETNEALRRSDEALKKGQEANTNLIETNRRRQQEIQANQSRLEDQSRRLNNVIADVQRRQPQFIAFSSGGGISSLGAISISRGNIVFSKSGSWSGNVAIFAWVDALLAYPIASQIFLSSSEREKEFRVGAFESVKAGLAIIVPD